MRGPIGVAPGNRISAFVLGCALALGLTACSDTSSDDLPAAANPATGGYSVQGALALLPSHDDDGALFITTADLDAATEQTGLQRPSSLDDADAVVAWLHPLTGLSTAGSEPAAVFVPFADTFQIDYLLTDKLLSFPEEVGWSVLDAETFVERQTPPQRFTVISGDFDSSTFPADLNEVADGIVTAGDGEDFTINPENGTAARPLGVPLRMAIEGRYLAASPSTDEITAWLDGSFETLADDPDLVAVAAALDDAGVISAVLSSGAIRSVNDHVMNPAIAEQLKTELADAVPADPFATVGIGWAIEDGESVITVAFKFANDAAAADALPKFEEMFTNAPSVNTAIPMSDLYSFQGAKADGSVAVVTLALGESGRTVSIFQALTSYDLPFVHQ